MNLNIRAVPDELANKLRHRASKYNMTLRDYVLTRLAKIVGFKGEIACNNVTRCPSCGGKLVDGHRP